MLELVRYQEKELAMAAGAEEIIYSVYADKKDSVIARPYLGFVKKKK